MLDRHINECDTCCMKKLLVLSLALYLGVLGAAVVSLLRQDNRGHVAASQQIKSMPQFLEPIRHKVVPIEIMPNFTIGTGFLVRLAGGQTAVVTNNHVCAAGVKVASGMFTVINGTPVYGLTVLKSTSKPDLCVLISNFIPTVPAIEVTAPVYAYGQRLVIVGFPLNGPQEPSVGYYVRHLRGLKIGSIMYENDSCDGTVQVTPFGNVCVITQDLEATTVPAYPGNSGSPVFDASGACVGVINSTAQENYHGNFIAGKEVLQFLRGL